MEHHERPGVAELRERIAVAETKIADLRGDVDTMNAAIGDVSMTTEKQAETIARLAAQPPANAGKDEREPGAGSSADGTAEPPADGPFSWFATSDHDLQRKAWKRLEQWVDQVLVPMYGLTTSELPPCWPLHQPVVEVLEAFRAEWVRIYMPDSDAVMVPPGRDAVDWHTRLWAEVRKALSTNPKDLGPLARCSSEHRPPDRQFLSTADKWQFA